MCLHILYKIYSFNIHSYTHRDICIFLAVASVKHSGLLQNPVDGSGYYLIMWQESQQAVGKYLFKMLSF